MLDDWLEQLTREPPEKRAKGQLRDLGNATRKTVTELTKHPNDHQTGDILHTHTGGSQRLRGGGQNQRLSTALCAVSSYPARPAISGRTIRALLWCGQY